MFAPAPFTLLGGLASLSLDELVVIARTLGVNDTLSSKARYLKVLPELISDRAFLRKAIRDLSADDRWALVKAAACETVSAVYGGAGVIAALGLSHPPAALKARGLLLPDGVTARYRVPQELLPAVRAEDAKILPAAPPAKGDVFYWDRAAAFRDALTIWSYVLKNNTPLTQSGAAPKRLWSKVAPLLEGDEDAEPYAAVVAALGVSRFELLTNHLLHLGALARRERDLEARPWLGASLERVEATFGASLLTSLLAADATGGALLAIYALLLSSPARPFVVEEGVKALSSLSPEITPEACRRALAASFAVGEAAAAWARDGRLLLTPPVIPPPLPAAALNPPLLVGANFEVKAPHDLPTRKRLQLEAFADRVDGGKLTTYAINKTTVYRALDAGITAAEIHAFLEREAGKPLPQNVSFSLADWSSQYGALSFTRGCFVVTEEEALAREISGLPGLQGVVEGPRRWWTLAFNDRDYDAVREALLAAGYLARSLPGRAVCDGLRELFYGPAQEGTPGAASASDQERVIAVLRFAAAAGRRVKIWVRSHPEARAGVVEDVSLAAEKKVSLRNEEGVCIIPMGEIERVNLL